MPHFALDIDLALCSQVTPFGSVVPVAVVLEAQELQCNFETVLRQLQRGLHDKTIGTTTQILFVGKIPLQG